MATNIASSPNDHDPELRRVEPEAEKDDGERGNMQKRKASSPSPTEDADPKSPKRTRLDSDTTEVNPSARLPTPKEPSIDRRESTIQEEKRRGKRLFGGLLSTLSQTTTSSQQKRRQEIERRQQAKVHQQQAEDDKQREEKLAKLSAIRRVEQVKFDEQVMRTRHSNMRATARFLQTQSRPKIYYLPWKPTEKQEDTIKDQIRDVEDIINKEVLEFKQQKEQRLRSLGVAVKPPTPEAKETVGRPDNIEPPTNISHSDSTNRAPSHNINKVGHEKESDRADDVMIEEDEDTVIY
ncbi:pinin/SDK/memA/ protein conserved region-domain-containing protein [Biscogniauxia sp. FL1348]|nr:pinin/SDK/memA/ protein conserved region-domain-containing protein [Biscogniauxia sp. FL1348]